MQCITSSAPARISTSPMLKTLLIGNELGTQKTSPRNCRCGWATAPELTKPSGSSAKPAFSRACGAAGMAPAREPGFVEGGGGGGHAAAVGRDRGKVQPAAEGEEPHPRDPPVRDDED